MAVMAVFVLTVMATPANPAALAQNMTGAGNMTTEGTNMTGTNATGSISSRVGIFANHIPPDESLP
jgi:hypothetical protein